MSKTTQTRRRKPRPQWRYNGLTLAEWQLNGQNVLWAQTDARFNAVVTVLLNEKANALRSLTGSEPRLLGAFEGYETAVNVLLKMAEGAVLPAATEPEIDYSSGHPEALTQFND